MTMPYESRHHGQPAARTPDEQLTTDVHAIPLADILRAANVHAPSSAKIEYGLNTSHLIVTVNRKTLP